MMISLRRLIFPMLILMGFAAKAQEDVQLYDLRELHPTQYAVGRIEVLRKTEKIKEMSDKKRQAFLAANPVPVIRGYGDKLYLIDHHHLSSAVLEAGFNQVYVKILEPDLSHLSEADFWREMQARGYAYMRDDAGKVISYDQLPQQIKDLRDDKYRSLAGAVREAGGYLKVTVPFTEFKWAQYFRKRIDFDNSATGLKNILGNAVDLASKPAASKLPGYLKGPSCNLIFN